MKAAYYSVFGAALLVCFLNRLIDLIYNKQNAAKEGRGEREIHGGKGQVSCGYWKGLEPEICAVLERLSLV